MTEKVALREAFGQALFELGKKNQRVFALTADLAESLRMWQFAKAFPDRFLDVGVAEENLIGVAAGLALGGYIPFAGSFGCFLTRAYDHIRVSVCQNDLHVVIVGSHGGVSNAGDGASAHALEDIAFMRALPNVTIVFPADANEMRKAVFASAEAEGPVYLRLYREPTAVFTDPKEPFTIGRGKVLREGKDLTLVACGPQAATALEVAEKLGGKIDIEVLSLATLKPLDSETITRSLKKTGRLITLEDHSIHGGLGDAVAEVLGEQNPVPHRRIGLSTFAESGNYDELIKKLGLDTESVAKAVEAFVKK